MLLRLEGAIALSRVVVLQLSCVLERQPRMISALKREREVVEREREKEKCNEERSYSVKERTEQSPLVRVIWELA